MHALGSKSEKVPPHCRKMQAAAALPIWPITSTSTNTNTSTNTIQIQLQVQVQRPIQIFDTLKVLPYCGKV